MIQGLLLAIAEAQNQYSFTRVCTAGDAVGAGAHLPIVLRMQYKGRAGLRVYCAVVLRVRAFAVVWRTCKRLAGAAGTRQPSF